MSRPRGRRGRCSAKLDVAPDLSLLPLLLLVQLTLFGTAAGQMITGSVSAVGSVGGGSGPTTMRTANSVLPASSLLASNGLALYKIVIPSLQMEDFAGSTNGTGGYVDAVGSAARFGYIADFTVTSDGLKAYVADESNHCIRLVDISTGNVSTFAVTNVVFNHPSAVTLSPGGGAFLYVADTGTPGIVKINIGTGQAVYVSPNNWKLVPIGLTMGTDQNRLFFSTNNKGIYAINPQDATVSLLDAVPQNGLSLRATSDGKYLFVVDTDWHAVRVIDLVLGGSRWICSPGGVAPPAGGPQQPSGSLETCLLGQPLAIVQVDARVFYISDKSRTTILKLAYNADFALTTVLTTPPASTTLAPTIAPPPVFTPRALSTTVLPTTTSVSPAGNGTAASVGNGGGSLALPLGVGLSVALLVALGFGLCIFFAVRDYRKNKNNPVTPFSRAVSFAVRSFRNSFGRGRFQHDGRRPLTESNASIASSSAAASSAAAGGSGRTTAAASFDALPNGGGRRPATASAGRQDRPPSAAAALPSGAWRQQPARQLASSQPAGGSRAPVAAAAGGGVQPTAAGYPPSYDVLRRQESDEHRYEALPSERLRPGNLASDTGGQNGAAAAAVSYGVGAGRGGSQAPTTLSYASDPYAAAAPARALESGQQQQQRRQLPPGTGDVRGPQSARPGATDLYGPSAASSYRASAPAGLPLSPSRLATSPEALSPLSNPAYGFAPVGGAQRTDNGRGQQLGRAPVVGGAAGAPERLGSGEPTGTARSINI